MSKWSWRTWLLLAILAAIILFIITDDPQMSESDIDGQEQEIGYRDGRQSNGETSAMGNGEPIEDLRLDYLVREKTEMGATNPFSPSSWYRPPRRPKPPPPPPPPPPYVAPAPTAPPLPFKYFGSYEDGPERIVLLLKGAKIYPVVEGDTIDNIYQVQKIVGSKIEIVYLPLGITQVIDTQINAFSAK